MILGSGLGDYAEHIQVEAVLDYHEIEGFPVSTVLGHKGRFVFGYIQDVPVVIMQGRVHYYEGYSMSDVVLPTRLMDCLSKGFIPDKCFRWNSGWDAGWRFYADHRTYFQLCAVSSDRTKSR